jgi:DNA-binding transcriptional regulator YiaG
VPAFDRVASRDLFAVPSPIDSEMENCMEMYPSLTNDKPPFHRLLRRRRQELRLLQAEIAAALHVTPEAVTLWESGRRRPDLSRIPSLAQVLQINPQELCRTVLQEYHPIFFGTLLGLPASAPQQIVPAA